MDRSLFWPPLIVIWIVALGVTASACRLSTSPTTLLGKSETTTSVATGETVSDTLLSTTSSLPQLEDEHQVTMVQGESETSFEFEALDPTRYAFEVTVAMPTGTIVDIRFHTVGGGTLSILDTERMAESCKIDGDEQLCHVRFPSLGAWSQGMWTAELRKLSIPEADVGLTILWIPAS